MQRALISIAMSLYLFFVILPVHAIKQENPKTISGEPGRSYYDFGIFAYEDGDYENAMSNFKMALTLDAENPFYLHYLGKTYQKMERHQEALDYLSRAWQKNPEMDELRYDLAMQYYTMSQYEKAIDHFAEEVKINPSNVLAIYYEGMSYYKLKKYEAALEYLNEAAQKSPSIKINGYYFAGLCYRKTGKIEKATEYLQYVMDNTDSETLKNNVKKWLEEIDQYQVAQRPLKLFLKLGYLYDDNVRLEPLDEDKFADEGDYLLSGIFTGKYNFINRENMNAGVEYSHYQTMHSHLEMYDLVGSLPRFYSQYRLSLLTFGFSYLPSLYWLDGQIYNRRQEFRPEVILKINEQISARMTYSYFDIDNVQDNRRDGYLHNLSANVSYLIPGMKFLILGGVDYEVYDASHPDQDYEKSRAKLGLYVNLPWELSFNISGGYNWRRYQNIDSQFKKTRSDDKYTAEVSLSRQLIYPWIYITLNYNYTRNDSNFYIFNYERQVTTLSLSTIY